MNVSHNDDDKNIGSADKLQVRPKWNGKWTDFLVYWKASNGSDIELLLLLIYDLAVGIVGDVPLQWDNATGDNKHKVIRIK